MTQTSKNKMFALAFADDEGGSFNQDSVSYDLQKLKDRVRKVFDEDIAFGEIAKDTVLVEKVDFGDPTTTVYNYEDENEESVLYAQIEQVDIL